MESCNGNHSLVEILRRNHRLDEAQDVARWCSKCGAIVVDVDFDNRTMPGEIMKMVLPSCSK